MVILQKKFEYSHCRCLKTIGELPQPCMVDKADNSADKDRNEVGGRAGSMAQDSLSSHQMQHQLSNSIARSLRYWYAYVAIVFREWISATVAWWFIQAANKMNAIPSLTQCQSILVMVNFEVWLCRSRGYNIGLFLSCFSDFIWLKHKGWILC